MERDAQRGSAIIMLFIALALFGAITYAFLQGSRGNTGMIENESNKAAGYQTQDCTNAIGLANKRMAARGCRGMISMNLDGTNDLPGAPADGSCSMFHPNGGGVQNCANTAITCSIGQLNALAVGQNCNGIVYAGQHSYRMYVHAADESASSPWNNGAAGGVTTNVGSTDGLINTNTLVNLVDTHSPYAAANLCRVFGARWYLPSSSEMAILNTNKTAIGGFGALNYWTSSENSASQATRFRLGIGTMTANNKSTLSAVRCVYRP